MDALAPIACLILAAACVAARAWWLRKHGPDRKDDWSEW